MRDLTGKTPEQYTENCDISRSIFILINSDTSI